MVGVVVCHFDFATLSAAFGLLLFFRILIFEQGGEIRFRIPFCFDIMYTLDMMF